MSQKNTMMFPTLSIIIPCRNEERYIDACLNSLLNTTYPHNRLEILIIDGKSEDSTSEIVYRYLHTDISVRLLENPERTTPKGLNIGINTAIGEFIIILSAHADYPADYAEKLVLESIRLNADCTGPVLQSKTLIQNDTANAIVNVLSDRFGVGSRFRSGVETITEVDTVAFGCYRRNVFEHIGLFDERLIRNQDIEFNKRLVQNGGKIYLLPNTSCTYYARDNLYEFARNNYQNGYWNILTAYYTGRFNALSLRHFIPLIFLLSILIPILFSILYPILLWISVTVGLSYFSIIGLRAWVIKKNTTWMHQITAFSILHFSYGIGSIGGIIALTKKFLFRDSK